MHKSVTLLYGKRTLIAAGFAVVLAPFELFMRSENMLEIDIANTFIDNCLIAQTESVYSCILAVYSFRCTPRKLVLHVHFI